MFHNKVPLPDELTQHRTKQTIRKIEFVDGTLSMRNMQDTEITGAGDINTTEIQHSSIIDGQHISDVSQILGQCQACGRPLTEISFRYCFFDATVLCPACSRYDEPTARWLCQKCNKSLKWKRFWHGIRRSLIAPFTNGKKQ